MTDIGISTIGLILLAYLWGSIPSAVLICHALDIPDPRKQGSGNPGTTNVLRIGNRRAAIFTLFADAGKGAIALLPCLLFSLPSLDTSLCYIAVILGHLFPFFGLMKGGKGIATTMGASISLFWPLACTQLLIWAVIFSIGRISSLASVAMALISPLAIWMLAAEYLLAILPVSTLLLLRHHQNIRKLLAGKEPRF